MDIYESILQILSSEALSGANLLGQLQKQGLKISKASLNRILAGLISENKVTKIGQARATKYKRAEQLAFFEDINIDEYFKKDIDERKVKASFDFKIFDLLENTKENLFTSLELQKLEALNEEYKRNTQEHSTRSFKKEFERLTIDLAWKSSQIEGNTYSLLETEALLNSGIEAEGKKRQEAIMLLNHKKALEYIFRNQEDFKEISQRKINELHSILTEDLGIEIGIRSFKVGIAGTNFRPIDNKFQIQEALDKTYTLINATKNIFCKSLLLNLLIAYIQAFEDGNKRLSRICSNAILYANNHCPLSYRSIKKQEYKKAILVFYEQNNLSYFKELFIQQFEFAVDNYW